MYVQLPHCSFFSFFVSWQKHFQMFTLFRTFAMHFENESFRVFLATTLCTLKASAKQYIYILFNFS